MIDNNIGRTWGNAPSGVRDARTLAWLGAFGCGLLMIGVIVILATTGLKIFQMIGTFNTLILFMYALFFPLYIWLLFALKRGSRSAYYVQMAISIIGLIGFPIGTLINGYILFKWFKPETKAWFGV